MSTNYIYYIIGGTAFLILAIWILSLEIRLKKIFRGNGAKDMESLLTSLNEDLKKLNVSKNEIERYLETVERRLQKSVQNVSTVRFNPFGNSGSNQSFAIAFLDEHGDGVVISSLYSREKVSVYAKPIKNYVSEYPLSEEEKTAIKQNE